MNNEEWQKLDPETSARVLGEAEAVLGPVPFNPAATTVRSQKPSFWRGHDILEITDLSTVPPARKFAIYKPGTVRVIDWTNRPIYETNEAAPLHLDERTVVEYVKFFFSYVRGRHGRFLVIETIDDIRWQIEPPAQGRKVMQEMLEPVAVAGRTDDGGFTLSAFMVFKDSLFRTRIQVRKDGVISMSDEELKIEGMPVLQDAAA
jgi:hypothetical protein